MKLSAPIHVLKIKAKSLKKEKSLKMSEALNLIAKEEGYSSWSLLQSKRESIYPKSYNEILNYFNSGDLVLVGARPGLGKTSFTIGTFVKAVAERKSQRHYYFSLAENHKDVAGRMKIYNKDIGDLKQDNLYLDYSDEICADYIIRETKESIQKGSLIVIDYLQMLDEKRANEPLQIQVEKLKQFAKSIGCIVVFISQLDRKIENLKEQRPTEDDVRLPNPLSLDLINKFIFLRHRVKMPSMVELSFGKKHSYSFYVNWNLAEIKFS